METNTTLDFSQIVADDRSPAAVVRTVAPANPTVSVVMPCLNESATLASCIAKAKRALASVGLEGEIIIADNGSTDGSLEIAARMGARIVPVAVKGYGSALIGGISAARGNYIIMADSDDSYDYGDIPRFTEELNKGFDFVIGNRLKGVIEPGAMPPLHRYLGTPVLTGIGKILYRSPIGDINCGMRAFTRDAWEKLQLRSPGMEFASEMIIRAALVGLNISEVPIRLAKDGRGRKAHLRTWSDGWRHLRLLLIYSPRWIFLYPGIALFLAGLVGMMSLLSGAYGFDSGRSDLRALMFSSVAVLVGYQILFLGAFSKILGITQGLLPQNRAFDRALDYINLESGLLLGTLCTLGAGVYLVTGSSQSIRAMLPGLVALTLGVQTIFNSFMFSMLGLVKRQ